MGAISAERRGVRPVPPDGKWPEATRRLKQFAMKYYPEEQLADREIAASGRAAQMFEITIEHVSGKEVQEKVSRSLR